MKKFVLALGALASLAMAGGEFQHPQQDGRFQEQERMQGGGFQNEHQGSMREGHQKNQQERQARFQEKKQEIVSRLSAALQCVQKASSPQELRSCQPNHQGRSNGGGMMERQEQERPIQPH